VNSSIEIEIKRIQKMLKELNNIFKVSKGRWKETELKRRNNIY